ncbi:hypothetical protein [Lysinibacillus xylanilyticus]|uniref:hypothetical protein n=1 Tax=Lysinibacillus xylanilyticus TaxID=582475 RepID=UPI003D03DD64
MYFSINAYKYLLGLEDTFRLTKEGEWRKQENFKLLDKDRDMFFESFQAANNWLRINRPLTINGKNVENDETVTDLFNDNYSFEIIAHRITKIKNPIFSREQLKEVLINGNDNYSNSLVIDYEGTPKLIPLISIAPLEVIEYPVRFETFNAGNGYVGVQSNLNHLDQTYLALLEAWYMHMETGRSFYRDYVSGDLSEEELISNIKHEANQLA